MFSEENEEVLERLRKKGDDLLSSREIDFTVVFRDEGSANGFASRFAAEDCVVSIERSAVREGYPWDVQVKKNMVPKNEQITAFEEFLQSVADSYGGKNDGWGCITQ